MRLRRADRPWSLAVQRCPGLRGAYRQSLTTVWPFRIQNDLSVRHSNVHAKLVGRTVVRSVWRSATGQSAWDGCSDRRQPLTMKVVQEVAVPAELTAQLESDPEALEAWTATPGELKSLYSSWIVAARSRRGKRKTGTRCGDGVLAATEGTLEGHVQRPSWIEALGSTRYAP